MVSLRSIGSTLVPQTARTLAAPSFILIVLLYLYTNGASPAIFGPLFSGFQQPLLVYILLAIAAIAMSPGLALVGGKGGYVASSPWWMQLLVFGGSFAVANIAIAFTSFREKGITAFVGPTIAVVIFNVALAGTEELFFRVSIIAQRLGPLLSSLLFAAFHSYVYGLSIVNLISGFAFGVAMFYIYSATRMKYGASANWGIHAGYNLALLGVTLLPVSAIVSSTAMLGIPMVLLVGMAISHKELEEMRRDVRNAAKKGAAGIKDITTDVVHDIHRLEVKVKDAVFVQGHEREGKRVRPYVRVQWKERK